MVIAVVMAVAGKRASLKWEEESVGQWLEVHPDYAALFVDKWLSSHQQSAQEILSRFYPCTPKSSSSMKPLVNPPKSSRKNHFPYMRFPSISLHQYKKKSIVDRSKLDKSSLFYELLTDIVSPNLNVNELTHKILVNILVLTKADRSSLFMVEGPEDNHILVSRLFDIAANTPLTDAIREDSCAIKMALGVGIAGTVAKTGEIINLKDAYKVSCI